MSSIDEKRATFELLFSSRRIKLFKAATRTFVHIDVEGTGKRLIFIAKDNGTFYHYMEDRWHPEASQGDPTCIYEWQNDDEPGTTIQTTESS